MASRKKSVGAQMVAKAKITFVPEKGKPVPSLTWTPLQGKDKNQWLAEGEWGGVPPRIKMLDARTYACYRDAQYLGSEATLEMAQRRCATNQISEKNRTMAEWEKRNTSELPPGVQLTAAERREYWLRHPPQAAPATTKGQRPLAAPRPDEDPATARMRAELAADGARTRTGRGRVAGGRGGSTGGAAEPPGAGVIRVGNPANPKRPGTGAHARWALLFSHDGKTVGEYRKAKGNMTTLANAMARKHVTVEEK